VSPERHPQLGGCPGQRHQLLWQAVLQGQLLQLSSRGTDLKDLLKASLVKSLKTQPTQAKPTGKVGAVQSTNWQPLNPIGMDY